MKKREIALIIGVSERIQIAAGDLTAVSKLGECSITGQNIWNVSEWYAERIIEYIDRTRKNTTKGKHTSPGNKGKGK